MANVAVVGAQWGDEGKGKIVDWLSRRADIVVRFQGGHNAGHTLVIDGQTYRLSLLPSGVVRRDKISMIGSGVVIDPWALLAEIDTLAEQGVTVTPERLRVAENACLILPLHGELDRAREAARGAGRIGTTGRGIGPAYEDKAGRRAIRLCDLADRELLAERLDAALMHHNLLRAGLALAPVERDRLCADLIELAPRLLRYCADVSGELDRARRRGRRILFEGAQGAMLDVDHGTYPYVTSSNTLAGAAAVGAGIGPRAVDYVLGIAKAYATRVGEGPFPTEQANAIGQALGERGLEFGTVTGRKRRCGWFDAVLARQAARLAGIDGVALTKLDVLDGFETIEICVGYRLGGESCDRLPASPRLQRQARPIYETVEGWRTPTRGARSRADLPAAAVNYIRRIEELIDAPVALLSTSPERGDTILVHDPFADR